MLRIITAVQLTAGLVPHSVIGHSTNLNSGIVSPIGRLPISQHRDDKKCLDVVVDSLTQQSSVQKVYKQTSGNYIS